MIALRPYQTRAVDAAREAIANGHQTILFVSPTGSGKTICIARIIILAIARGKKCDFLSHRAELNRQCLQKLIEGGVPPASICIVERGRITGNPDAPVRIGSVQTLHRRGARQSDLLFIDEAHRSMAKQHRELITSYRSLGARVLGFTATPARLDGASLGDVYEKMIIIARPAELLEEGFIVSPMIYTVPEKELPILEGIATTKSDFAQQQLAEAVGRSELIGSITEHWMQRSRSPSMCFAVNRGHSLSIVKAFEARGIKALHIDGESSEGERSGAIAKLRRGEVQIVSQCELWIEGVDIPEVRCAILARPTQSVTIHLQTIGRVMRPYQGQSSLVLDHAGNVRRLGLPTDDRPWSLEPGKRRSVPVDRAKSCPQCYLVMANMESVCPSCTYVFGQETQERPIRTKRGELVLLREQEVWERRKKYWDSLWERAWQQDDPHAFVHSKFIDRYKIVPKESWVEPERTEGKEVEAEWLRKMSAKAFYGRMSWEEIDRLYFNRFGKKRV